MSQTLNRYSDRSEAGLALADRLKHYANRDDISILALPRGGVPVAYEIAKSLNVPMDVFLVRKMGAPGREELAMGAVAEGGVRVMNNDIVRALGIPDPEIERVAEREEKELQRRADAYRGDREPLEITARIAILVDDGLATGATMRSAAKAVRQKERSHVVIAVPVAPAERCSEMENEADEVICEMQPADLMAISRWYVDFAQVTDQEVRDILERARKEQPERNQQ